MDVHVEVQRRAVALDDGYDVEGYKHGIRVTNVTGEITAETTNGDIVIDNARTSNLEASTVNGDLTFNGTIRDHGVYRLTTHGGDIRVGLGGATNATVFVRTFQGDFTADFPIQLPDGQAARSGSKRFNFTLGNGSASSSACPTGLARPKAPQAADVGRGSFGSDRSKRRRRRVLFTATSKTGIYSR